MKILANLLYTRPKILLQSNSNFLPQATGKAQEEEELFALYCAQKPLWKPKKEKTSAQWNATMPALQTCTNLLVSPSENSLQKPGPYNQLSCSYKSLQIFLQCLRSTKSWVKSLHSIQWKPYNRLPKASLGRHLRFSEMRVSSTWKTWAKQLCTTSKTQFDLQKIDEQKMQKMEPPCAIYRCWSLSPWVVPSLHKFELPFFSLSFY